MNSLKIALIVMMMQMIEANNVNNNTQENLVEKIMNKNVTSWNDYTETDKLDKSETNALGALINSKSNENSESHLSMNKSDDKNESRISVIDSIYLSEEESSNFCQKALNCEEKLKLRELICQRQHAYPNLILEPKTELFDMYIQAEFIANTEIPDQLESVSKACLQPITNDVLRQLSEYLREMIQSREKCIRRTASYHNLLPIRHKAICERIVSQEIENETDDVKKNKFNNLESRQNALDYCKVLVAPKKKECETLRQCCSSYVSCTELMMEKRTWKKYEEILERTKQVQNNCEKNMMTILQSIRSIPSFNLLPDSQRLLPTAIGGEYFN